MRLGYALFANDRASVNQTICTDLSSQGIIDEERHCIVHGKCFAGAQQRDDKCSAVFFFLPGADFTRQMRKAFYAALLKTRYNVYDFGLRNDCTKQTLAGMPDKSGEIEQALGGPKQQSTNVFFAQITAQNIDTLQPLFIRNARRLGSERHCLILSASATDSVAHRKNKSLYAICRQG
ncbi:hypothetical protein D9M69_520540 [compost metagenome]